jgi:hypothetical protein
MDKPLLSNKEQFPTEEVIFSHIGKSRTQWKAMFDYIHLHYPEFTEEWRYYKDGKSWLFKTVKKAKTIFWLSVIPNSFKATFYFGDKAEQAILDSSISDLLKDSFQNGKRYGKIRGITIQIESQSDIDNVISLIEIKLKLK